jgi:hypothetical protein
MALLAGGTPTLPRTGDSETRAFSDRAAFALEPSVDQCPRKDELIEAALWFIWQKSLPVSLPLEYTRVSDYALAGQDLHRHDLRAILLQPVGPLKQQVTIVHHGQLVFPGNYGIE